MDDEEISSFESRPPAPDDRIRPEFRLRQESQRRRSYGALIAAAAAWGLGRFVPCAARNLLYLAAIIYVCWILVLTFRNWRCPACERMLGERLDIDECPHCRTRF